MKPKWSGGTTSDCPSPPQTKLEAVAGGACLGCGEAVFRSPYGDLLALCVMGRDFEVAHLICGCDLAVAFDGDTRLRTTAAFFVGQESW